LSSHRDYESEKDWELLRNDSPYADALQFEETSDAGPSGSKRYEMVVTSRWSSLVGLFYIVSRKLTQQTKSNRDDGSYASGDLYEKHPTKKGVWRYVGRGDDVIVMVSRPFHCLAHR
jgi:acyl-coenzyme A synthetase/AMP-(fatty) acid ligase